MTELGHVLEIKKVAFVTRLECSHEAHQWGVPVPIGMTLEDLLKAQDEHDKQWDEMSELDRRVEGILAYTDSRRVPMGRYEIQQAREAFRDFLVGLLTEKDAEPEETSPGLLNDGAQVDLRQWHKDDIREVTINIKSRNDEYYNTLLVPFAGDIVLKTDSDGGVRLTTRATDIAKTIHHEEGQRIWHEGEGRYI